MLVSLVDFRGVRYYGSHLSKVQVSVGQRVSRGQRVGSVGDTGNAKGTGCHLHFGLSPACLTGWQNRRGKLAPQPYLDSWRKGARNDRPHGLPVSRSSNRCAAVGRAGMSVPVTPERLRRAMGRKNAGPCCAIREIPAWGSARSPTAI